MNRPTKTNDDIEQVSQKSFQDIGGCEDAKDAIREVIDYIKNPGPYKRMNVHMPKGVILYGPPGTGKTLIAKATATETQIPMIYIAGSDFVELYVGSGAKRVRDLFNRARELSKNAPACMIFIDEIDAVGFKRNHFGMGQGNRESDTTLNQLLNEMDGFQENDRIVVVAATNMIESIDPALQRANRFDRKIEVKLPDAKSREQILQIHLKGKNHTVTHKDIQLAACALNGLSGADIENLVNLLALTVVRKANYERNSQPVITGLDFNDAVKQYIAERQKLSPRLNNQRNMMPF